MRSDAFSFNPRRGIGTIPVIAGSCAVAVVGLGLWTVHRSSLHAIEADRAQTASALHQANQQIQDLTSRLNTLAEQNRKAEAERAAATQPPQEATQRAASTPNRKPRPARPVRNSEQDKLKQQLSETRNELASTRSELSRAEQDLDGKIASTRNDLASTRDDLNGSIARNHDEVVALQRRGEQNVYEFKLAKSKQAQRVGPLGLTLRSTSTKHNTYDLTLLVDDNSIAKKHLSLLEPVWVTVIDRPQPVQLVVNRISKDGIEGYVSEPRYKKSELAANSGTPPAAAPQQGLSTR
jgi:hypothetical protein